MGEFYSISGDKIPFAISAIVGQILNTQYPSSQESRLPIFEPLKPASLATLRAGRGCSRLRSAETVASLLTAEIEALVAGSNNWGTAIAASVVLQPTPMAELRAQLSVEASGRVSVVDNTLWACGEAQPCATVRVTLLRERGRNRALPIR